MTGAQGGVPISHRRAGDAFDAAHGVDTSGVTPIGMLRTVGNHRDGAVDHIAIDVTEMATALAALPLTPERFVFVDLGAGKGRAALLASRLPFKQIIGVEFAPALVEIAQRNARRFRDTSQRCFNLQFICEDATEYELAPEPFVLFLYNPFSAEVMARVVRRTLASLRSHPREGYVLYANPFHAGPWIEAGFSVLTKGPTFMLLRPAGTDSAR